MRQREQEQLIIIFAVVVLDNDMFSNILGYEFCEERFKHFIAELSLWNQSHIFFRYNWSAYFEINLFNKSV